MVISVLMVVTWAALGLMTGTRRVLSAATFTVTNTGDNGGVNPAPGAGTGTLRQAIIDANAMAGADTIGFAAGVTGTITLASAALPQITQDLTITNRAGGGFADSEWELVVPSLQHSGSVTVSISGLTISNGVSASGGGINNAGTLTVTNSTFSSNSVNVQGGGIFNGGTLTVTNSTFSGNSAANGGGICNDAGRTVTVANSTLSGNSARVGGGGIVNQVCATVTIANSTLRGNSLVSAAASSLMTAPPR